MKIGVFGDSFAHTNFDTGKGWVSLLSKKYNVENYALTCTPLYYSYQKILENINNIDIVILAVTAPGRLYVPQVLPDLMPANIGTIETILNDKDFIERSDSVKVEIFKSARQYYLHLSNFEFDKCVHKLLLNDIRDICIKKNKKLIAIPALYTDEIFTLFEEGFTLQNVFELERKHWQLYGIHKMEKEMQHHLSDENNLVLYEILATRLTTDNNRKYKLEDFISKPIFRASYFL